MLTIKEIKALIEKDATSVKKTLAKQGLRYYEGEHDILNYKIYYYDASGKLQEDKYKSNIRICHPFFTELVDQQAQYMLSGDNKIFRSDIPELQAELDTYFDDDFYSEVYELLTDCISRGFEYMYAVTGKDGRTRFECADSIGVIEVPAKDTEDGCEYYIFWYIERIEKGNKAIKRIQVWDDKGIYFYSQVNDGKIVEDNRVNLGSAVTNYRPHTIKIGENGELSGKSFGFIPFFRLDNGRKQLSGLKPIKALIDDYDLMACGLSNNLQDFTDAIYVVSGYPGSNLDEVIQNIKAKKHIGVDSDGGVDIKTIDIPYEARKVKLELDEKNIYRFGMGFNSAQLGDGNITNIVIKSRYALLDLKCNKLEIRLKQLFRKLLELVLAEVNAAKKTDYQLKDVYFVFEREVMTNAQDNAQIELADAQRQQTQINTLLSLANVLGNETVIQQICDILDLDYDEIKDKLPTDPAEDVKTAEDDLAAVVTEGSGDLVE